MKKLQEEYQYKHERLTAGIMVVLVAVVVALSIGRVYAANRLVEASEKLRLLDNKIAVLDSQNQALEEEVRTQQSTEVLSQKAKTLGFIVNSHYSFLTPAPQMALEIVRAKQLTR